MFGEIIKKARLEKGFSLEAGAKFLGLPKTTLWRLESGNSTISAQRFVDIAAKYGYSISHMLEGHLVASPSLTDFDRLGMVVEQIETIIQRLDSRPKPPQVRAAVVEVLKLETARVIETDGAEFSPDRYDGLVAAIFSA